MTISEYQANSPFIKTRYYPGKLLHASDFINEQEYVDRKLGFISCGLYGYGIIGGLRVETGRNGELILGPGSAVDGKGRILTVPEKLSLDGSEIDGLKEDNQEFILGITYAERVVERERCLLSEREEYKPARVAESFSLRAYGTEELLWAGQSRRQWDELFTQSSVLYEGENVSLTLRAPRIVPSDSVFRIELLVRSDKTEGGFGGWSGKAALQGAYFAQSGAYSQRIEEKETELKGDLWQSWELMTEGNRELPIVLELKDFHVFTGRGKEEIPAVQLYIETAQEYEKAVRDGLERRSDKECAAPPGEGYSHAQAAPDWVPLAYVGAEKNGGGGYKFSLKDHKDIRVYCMRPWQRDVIDRAKEQGKILDMRKCRLFCSRFFPPEQEAAQKKEPEAGGALADTDEEVVKKYIRHGTERIRIPRGSKRGQVFYSEKIAHGFPGQEVIVWWERQFEERSYAYWNKNRTVSVHGKEAFFKEVIGDTDFISEQAVCQNVAEGTFRIAFTLKKGRRSRKDEEVVISWTALRVT